MYYKIMIIMALWYIFSAYAIVLWRVVSAPPSLAWFMVSEVSVIKLFTEMLTFQSFKTHPAHRYRELLIIWHYALMASFIYQGWLLAGINLVEAYPAQLLLKTIYLGGACATVNLYILRVRDAGLSVYMGLASAVFYVVLIVYFLTGCAASSDQYYAFWKTLFSPERVEMGFFTKAHLVSFALLMLVLPWTRAMHYWTRICYIPTTLWSRGTSNAAGWAMLKALYKHPNWNSNHCAKIPWNDQLSVIDPLKKKPRGGRKHDTARD